MDQQHVDRLARILAASSTRRAGFRAALAAALGLAAAPAAPAAPVAPVASASAKPPAPPSRRKPRPAGPCGDGTARDNACTRNAQCCTGYCKLTGMGKRKAGRCRCVRRGMPCTSDASCCGPIRCKFGVCGGKRPAPAPLVETGKPCNPASDTCRDTDASCEPYDSGDPAGDFCLLPRGASCSASADCQSFYCLDDRCVSCSHPACSGPCTPNVCPTCAYTTVQAAITALQGTPANVVTIAPGRYVEDLTVTGDIVLRACPGDRVILRNATGSATNASALRTITSTGGAIDLINIIVDGTGDKKAATPVYGGGIQTDRDLGLFGSTVLRNANFNYPIGGGGAVVRGNGLTVTITDNVVVENNGTDSYGGGVLVRGESDVFVSGGVVFRGNVADSYGAGLTVADGCNLSVTDDVQFVDNIGKSGGGFGVINWSANRVTTALISGNVLVRNNRSVFGNGEGGGINIYGNGEASPVMATFSGNVRVLDNEAVLDGGGLSIWDSTTTIEGNVLIAGNSSAYGGGIFYGGHQSLSLTIAGSAVIRENIASSNGAGLLNSGGIVTVSGAARVSANIAEGNGGGAALARRNDYGGRNAALTVESGASITGNSAPSGGGVFSDNPGNTLAAAAGTITANTPDNCAGAGISCP